MIQLLNTSGQARKIYIYIGYSRIFKMNSKSVKKFQYKLMFANFKQFLHASNYHKRVGRFKTDGVTFIISIMTGMRK